MKGGDTGKKDEKMKVKDEDGRYRIPKNELIRNGPSIVLVPKRTTKENRRSFIEKRTFGLSRWSVLRFGSRSRVVIGGPLADQPGHRSSRSWSNQSGYLDVQ